MAFRGGSNGWRLLLCAGFALLSGRAAAATCPVPAWLGAPPANFVQESCEERAWAQIDVALPEGWKTVYGATSVMSFTRSNPKQATTQAALRDPVVAAANSAGGQVVSRPADPNVTWKGAGPGGNLWIVFSPRGSNDEASGFSLTTIREIPLPQEILTKPITAPLDATAPCADPPWLARSFPYFTRGSCDNQAWTSDPVQSLLVPDVLLEGRRLAVNYRLNDPAKTPTSIALQRNFVQAFKAMGARIVTQQTDIDRVVASLKTPLGELWFLYQAGDGNDGSRGSYTLTTYQVQPLHQDVVAKALTTTSAVVAGGPCADPPWQVRGLPQYQRQGCESRDWDVVHVDYLGGNQVLEGRRTTVSYEAVVSPSPPASLPSRNYRNALGAVGATLVSKDTDIDRVVAKQATRSGEVWYVYQAGSGNSDHRSSYSLITVAIAPFPQEVKVRAMPEGLQQPKKACANPPWLVRQFAGYQLDTCTYQDFAPLTIDLPSGPKELAGRVLVANYTLAEKGHVRLPAAIWRNYVTALQAQGAKLVTDPKNSSIAVLTQTRGKAEYWYLYQGGGGNDEGAASYSLSTLQIGGPPPKACTIEVYGVNFDFDKSALRPDSEPVLEQLRGLFAANPSFAAEIGGHTDDVGTPAYNLKLSDARAASVKAWLVQHGVAASRLTSHGYGDSRPLVPNSNDANRFKNRRVELKRKNCR